MLFRRAILISLLLLNIFTTLPAHATATREWTEKNLGDSGAEDKLGTLPVFLLHSLDL